ncbi:MAG TPA: hypothetical protein VJ873_03475 [bacterium]|nr:hypothetical protein [bacterium]
MKKLTWILGLLLLLGSTGIASAYEGVYVSGPRVAATVAFPGLRLVFGHPGIYCWYGGRYYSRGDWDRYSRFHRDRVVYNRFHRDNNRRFDRDDLDHRGYRNDGDHFNHQDRSFDHDRN